MSRLEVERLPLEGQVVVALRGDVDLATAEDFRAALLDGDPAVTVVADLAGVTFMDSSGILALDQVLRAAAAAGRNLFFVPRFTDSVRTVLQITGVLDVLPLAPGPGIGAA